MGACLVWGLPRDHTAFQGALIRKRIAIPASRVPRSPLASGRPRCSPDAATGRVACRSHRLCGSNQTHAIRRYKPLCVHAPVDIPTL